jgi:ribosomal protein S15
MLKIEKEKYLLHRNDTGSTAIQIIFLREKIEKEKNHLKNNHKDVSVKRSLLKKIAGERRLFSYLKRRNPEVYFSLKKDLNLKV